MNITGRHLVLVIFALLAGQVVAQGMPPLVAAAKGGEWEVLQTMVSAGGDVNVSYGDGTTALHWASYHENPVAAQSLIDAGADVNARTDLGVTALWLAAENASAEMSGLLLKAGANPDARLLSGESIVMTAARSGGGSVVELLLAAGADPNVVVMNEQTALMWAAGQGHSSAVEALLRYGADVDARTQVQTRYVKSEKEQDSHPAYKTWVEQGGNTALMFAARAGDLRSVQLLVDAGSDVNGLSAFGTSPAIMAVHGGNTELLAFLLESGADINSAASGHTALHAAVLRGNYDAVSVLIEHGADLNALLERPTPTRRQSADYNFHDALIGATPLWLAARFAEPQIMQLLLDSGADPSITNHVSFPAQRLGEHFIADEGEISLVMAAVGMGHRRLRMSWGNPERRAGRLGQDREAFILESVQVAVLTGVDINLRNADGQTALAFARARYYDSVEEFLMGIGATD